MGESLVWVGYPSLGPVPSFGSVSFMPQESLEVIFNLEIELCRTFLIIPGRSSEWELTQARGPNSNSRLPPYNGKEAGPRIGRKFANRDINRSLQVLRTTAVEGHPPIDDQLATLESDRRDLLRRVVEVNSQLKSYDKQFQKIFTTVRGWGGIYRLRLVERD